MTLLKICIVGDENVGIKSLAEKFGLQTKNNSTANMGFFVGGKELTIHNQQIKFQIWALSHQGISPKLAFYGGIAGAIILFDVTNKESFENLPTWINEIFDKNKGMLIPIALVGTKTDLRTNNSKSVSDVMAEAFCQKLTEKMSKEYLRIRYFPVSLLDTGDFSYLLEELGGQFIESNEIKKAKDTYIDDIILNYLDNDDRISEEIRKSLTVNDLNSYLTPDSTMNQFLCELPLEEQIFLIRKLFTNEELDKLCDRMLIVFDPADIKSTITLLLNKTYFEKEEEEERKR